MHIQINQMARFWPKWTFFPFCKHIYIGCMFLSCHVHVLKWIRFSHSYLYSILVFSYYPNAMKIVKAEEMYSILIYFHCYNLLLYFLFDTHFWWIYNTFSCFIFIENDISMKPLIIEPFYDMKTIFLAFCYQEYSFFFHFFWAH